MPRNGELVRLPLAERKPEMIRALEGQRVKPRLTSVPGETAGATRDRLRREAVQRFAILALVLATAGVLLGWGAFLALR